MSLRELQNKYTSHLNHANFNFAISKNTHGAPVQPFHVHRQKEKKVLFVFTRNMMTKTVIFFDLIQTLAACEPRFFYFQKWRNYFSPVPFFVNIRNDKLLFFGVKLEKMTDIHEIIAT